MDFPIILFLYSCPLSFLCNCIIIFFICFFLFLNNRPNNHSGKLPQGPSPYPIVGNILELGTKPHQSLANLSKIYGPLMTLKLGSITTIVISSPDVAKEALQKNDLIFSGRTIPHTGEALDHHKYSVAFIHPSSVLWKTLRRVCITSMFSPLRLDSSQNLRRNKLQHLLDYVDECCTQGEALDIGEATFAATLNSISNTLFSIDLVGFSSGSSREFKDLICGILEEAGSPNISDFFPFLRSLDPQRKRSRMNSYFRKIFKFIDDIIEERIQVRASKSGSKVYGDVLDSFLDLMEEENSQLRRSDVLHLLVVSIFLSIHSSPALTGCYLIRVIPFEYASHAIIYPREKATSQRLYFTAIYLAFCRLKSSRIFHIINILTLIPRWVFK